MARDQNSNLLKDEYLFLQHCYEENDRSALWIKCISIVVFSALMIATAEWPGPYLPLVAATVSGLFWLTEAIWKTFQSRLEERIIAIENYFQANGGELPPLQIYSTWLRQRGGVVALLQEYAKSAIRPTIVVPYLLLIILSMAAFYIAR